MLKGTEMAGNSAQVGEDRGTLANWVSLEIAAELQAAVQGFTPRERRAGPAAPALGSKERAEAFLVQPPENWAMEEAAVGVGKCMGVTSVIDVLCNPGEVTEHLMPILPGKAKADSNSANRSRSQMEGPGLLHHRFLSDRSRL
nr:uncharacterized protein LOC110365618 isoform X5 [Columba livia]